MNASGDQARKIIALREVRSGSQPFITVAIPHYKHRQHLELVLESIFKQDMVGFEILVSNDCSPDDSDQVIPELLERSGCMFQYYSQSVNLGYDGNVRFCLGAASGEYVFLLGNDDAVANKSTLHEVASDLRVLGYPDVAVVNFESWDSGTLTRRATTTSIIGSGPEVALANYRKFSFVSGLIFKHTRAQEHETDKWDKSIFYQIYLATRIIAAGGKLGMIDQSAVRKDVQVDGLGVPNYVSKMKAAKSSFQSRHTGIDSVLRVTWDAVRPYTLSDARSRILTKLLGSALKTLHPFWIMEYRRIANWSAGFGVARSNWPAYLLKEYSDLHWIDRMKLWITYFMTTTAALFAPMPFFERLKKRAQAGQPPILVNNK